MERLKNEDEQWRNNLMWYKGSYEDKSQTSTKPIDAKTFKTYDHHGRLAYSHKKALVRAEIMSEAANDIYRTHKMPMNKEDDGRSRAMEKEARTTYQSIRPVCEPMMADGHRLRS